MKNCFTNLSISIIFKFFFIVTVAMAKQSSLFVQNYFSRLVLHLHARKQTEILVVCEQ
jgi:hypothetical protein